MEHPVLSAKNVYEFRIDIYLWLTGADKRFLPGGREIFQAEREKNIMPPPPVKMLPTCVWGQSYNRGGQTFVTFIDHDLFICVVLLLFFSKTSSSNKHTGIK